jgi:NAD+ kinase
MSAQVTGIIANTRKPGAAELVPKVVAEFRRHGAAILLEEKTASFADAGAGLPTRELAAQCGLIVVLGGDGTMLHVAHEVGESAKPLFGINLGALGFLTCAAASDYEQAVAAVVRGEYVVSRRSQLAVEVCRDGGVIAKSTALNDAVIGRGEISRVIRLDVRVNGSPLTEYNADGLIISTPTGSTAYSLAAGGAILSPETDVFVITPICPHVLANRSLIVADSSVIETLPSVDGRDAVLTVDGQEMMEIRAGDVIRVRRAAYDVPLAMPREVTFFEVLRQKLKWSGSAV